jgi:D-ribose pyranase
VERVDLAVAENLPRFLDLLDVVLAEVAVEDVPGGPAHRRGRR